MRRFHIVAAAAIMAVLALSPNSARAQATSVSIVPPPSSSQSEDVNAVRSALRSVESAIQTRVIDARDQIQSMVTRLVRSRSTQAPAFDTVDRVDPYSPGYDPFEALGYAKSGMVTKARPLAAHSLPNYYISLWGQGSQDHEERSGFLGATNLTSRTNTTTGVVGGDYIRIGVSSSTDALVIGALGSESSSRTTALLDNTKTRTTGAGMYAAYINGGFSTDVSILVSVSKSSGLGGGGLVPFNTSTDGYTYIGNIQYKYDLSSTWWIEPTLGFSYSHLRQNVALTTDGNEVKFQGGARVGTELEFGSVKVTPSLTGLAYISPSVEIIHALGTTFVGATDEGYLWGKGIGKVNFQWSDKFSTSVEGEIRGRADVLGYAGRIMARYTF